MAPPAATAVPSDRFSTLSLLALVCSALGGAVLLGFFVVGLSDGSVSSFNIALWLALLGLAAGSLWGGAMLRSKRRYVAATLVLAITAVPAGLAAAFMLLILVAQPRWN